MNGVLQDVRYAARQLRMSVLLASVAKYISMRRATKVDPIVALRYE